MQAGELKVAVIGSGIAGLSCAWLLSQRHHVTLYEQSPRLGGHAHTVTVPGEHGPFAVDTGFIVYNEPTYPNLTALFAHLSVPTQPSDMSFAASLPASGPNGGRLEYAGTGLAGLFGQRRNLVRPRFWSMLRDLRRLYAEAPRDSVLAEPDLTPLADWLAQRRYGSALIQDHLLPMAAAIWSGAPQEMLAYPAAAFFRFFDNHGLLRLDNRPDWRTVTGGSQAYVSRLAAAFRGEIRSGRTVTRVDRHRSGITVHDSAAPTSAYDHVVLATHADQALALLGPDADTAERRVLGAIGSSRNVAVLHRDARLMPKRRRVWASWNFIGGSTPAEAPCVTYWMNNLQGLPGEKPIFVTLNPPFAPAGELHRQTYDHPRFDVPAMAAQREIWRLQGLRRTWFCGAWCGAGFHEDGLQAGLAVAESLGLAEGLGAPRRPWQVQAESGRIFLTPPNQAPRVAEFA
jgi:predicted NAD/FAD-binding protein